MYKHQPLKEARSIRLLKLATSTLDAHEAPLSCELAEVAIDSDPTYDALSYTWDAQKPEIPIKCNGEDMLVTQNCHAALLRLRRLQLCTLW